MIKNAILSLVRLIHFLFILFVVLVPFIGNNYFLLLHFIIVPFIMFHWILNDNTCCLTVVEKLLANDKDYECITCKIIEPIYDFKKNYNAHSNIIYLVTTLLWLIATYRLYSNYKASGTTFNFESLTKFLLA